MTVRLFPVSAPSETLLTLIPSAQIDVILLFCTFPPVPEAQRPDMVCWVQMPSASQSAPVVSIAPPSPPMVLRLTALASMWKLRTVQEVRSNSAAGGVLLGTGTSR
ncbi:MULTISPECIES: hypothetical protein [Streptomyces]|uniref:hypothetical protein n=1 Tax=Streptomyces TaxID=1883 RepID=UPI001F505210|nr:hypothetical protein [Streptomyces sp. WAC00263]